MSCCWGGSTTVSVITASRNNGSEKAYVGVIAQEVRAIRPDAAFVGRDGYLRVSYERLGLVFRSYDDWAASGGRLPKPADH